MRFVISACEIRKKLMKSFSLAEKRKKWVWFFQHTKEKKEIWEILIFPSCICCRDKYSFILYREKKLHNIIKVFMLLKAIFVAKLEKDFLCFILFYKMCIKNEKESPNNSETFVYLIMKIIFLGKWDFKLYCNVSER